MSPAVSFYFFQCLFILNDKSFKSIRFEILVWTFIKFDLFEIKGGCQNSGYCCQHLMLQDKGKPINTVHLFESLKKKEPIFNRFHIAKREAGKIIYFGCSSLSKSLLCLDYETRPRLCRQYPYSVFLEEDRIRAGCGYFVNRKKWRPTWVYSRLDTKIKILEFNNGIIA